MSAPERVQLSRKKGWKLPPNTVVVARPTKWGNPFAIKGAVEVGIRPARAQAFVVECFDSWLRGDRQHWMGRDSDAAADWMMANLPALQGKNLACWCKPGEPCHADILLELANAHLPEPPKEAT